MAASTQFKVPCPSCEAQVPIKDNSLIGKKVDCPKCKYRFVVEEPGDADSGETEAKSKPESRDRGAAKPKPGAKKGKMRLDDELKPKKKGGSTVLIVGGVIGLLAVVGLIVGGILLFGGSGSSNSSSSQASNSTPSNRPSNSSPTSPTSPTNPDNSAKDDKTGDEAAGETSLTNITNLLPNDTQSVYTVPVNKFASSTPGSSIFRSGSGFRIEEFRERLGLPFDQMNKFVRAESLKNNWAFNVIQMYPAVTLKADALKAKLGGQKGPKSPIKGHQYFLVSSNDVVDTMSAIDLASVLNKSATLKSNTGLSLAWHIYDEHTVILADVPQMEQFLQNDRKPTQLSQLTTSDAGGGSPYQGGRGSSGPPPGGKGGAGPGAVPLPSGPPSSSPGGATPIGGGGAGSGPAEGNDNAGAVYTDKPTYLTLKPELKRMLDDMEQSQKGFIFSCGAIELDGANVKAVDAIRSISGLGAQLPLPAIKAAGLGIHVFSDTRLTGVAALELKDETDARALDNGLKSIAFPLFARKLGDWMGGITIDVTGQANAGMGGAGMPGMGPGMVGPGPGMIGPGPGMVGPGPGMIGPGPGMGGPGMAGAAGPRGGPGMGSAAGPRGGPGMGSAAGPRGGPGMVPGPGMTGPGMTGPGTDADKPTDSSLRSWYSGKYVFITFDLEVNSATDEKFHRTIENQVVRLKGVSDVLAMTAPRYHELASTAVQIAGKKQPLHGTYRMAVEEQTLLPGGAFVSRPPNQRVSFLADLLPYLGRDEIYGQIDKNLSWRDDKNLKAAGHWIPQFINPAYPRSSWQAHVPSLPNFDFGATHFVGLSGIGLDAAEYPDDPAYAKKLGLFGYNRETRLDNIKDGAANTIYMIQVPPTFQRPWIAGGGATVMGVPETNSVAPFVAKQANGKMGTYALMADGSVRFIAADILDKTFQALVTKDGGDDAGDINGVAPLVPPNNAAPAPKSAAPAPKPATDKK